MAFDVDRVNGQVVSYSYPHTTFQDDCRALGATEMAPATPAMTHTSTAPGP
jgi:hypothetical protein